ncbi:MAG: cysteine hydrolase [Clostridia bacterium]|nr:cysteine hydrolase [Clostridia bacterium]
MKVLCVIDMQNDFIDGALGTKEAEAIVKNVADKIEAYRKNGDTVIFTRDTHHDNYMETQEGRNLPVPHCIKGTDGWQISSKLTVGDSKVIDKPTFGSTELSEYVAGLNGVSEIELIGLCTDICVISNAMLLKAKLPEVKMSVDSACCAGVTPESHNNALSAMKMCQIEIV